MSVHIAVCENNNYESVFEDRKTIVTMVRVKLSRMLKTVVEKVQLMTEMNKKPNKVHRKL